jgi:hypothetical protein
MPDLLESSASWLADRLKAWAAHEVSVQPPEGVAVALMATIGRTEFAVDDGQGSAVQVETRDFIFRYADWRAAFANEKPDRGWRIAEDRDGASLGFDVVAPGNEPAWRLDAYGKALRVHTTLAAEEG